MENTLIAESIDLICLGVAVLMPIALVVRYRWWGVAAGATTAWGSLIMAGMLISRLDQTRDADMFDGVWIYFGWLAGLVYCLLLLFVRDLAIRIAGQRSHNPTADRGQRQ